MSHENHPQNTHTDTHSTTKCFQAVTIIVMRIIIINSYALVVFFPLRTKKFRYKAKKTSTQWQDIILGGFIVHYINHLSVLSV